MATRNDADRDLAEAREPDPESIDTRNVSRRGFGRHLLLSASALAVIFAAGKQEQAQAAPVGDPWKLGGNSNITSNGTNFLGTINTAPLIFKTNGAERMRIFPSGHVAINLVKPDATLHTRANGLTGIIGETPSTTAGAVGVHGTVMSRAPGASSAGVRGTNKSTSSSGVGVRGSHDGSGYGVHGTSVGGYGMYGDGGYNGVYGKGGEYGVIGSSSDGYGVYGSGPTAVYASGGTHGVKAFGSTHGVYGSSSTYGLYGQGGSYGVVGDGTAAGVYGSSAYGNGVEGTTTHPNTSAVYGYGGQYGAHGNAGRTAGVRGDSGYVGVWGEGGDWGFFSIATKTTGQNYGIMAESKSPQGYGGWFKGRVHVEGVLSKGGGAFKIDHPLDPGNKYLSHSFVESPDMMNIYNGNVVLDQTGAAVVTLPEWFEALNQDFRYQLTTIGGYAPVYIAEEIAGNRFKIAGGKPGMKVSWQVTGVRHDAFANANRIPVEEDKPANERGRFLHPEALGQPATLGLMAGRAPQAPGNKAPQLPRVAPARPVPAPAPREPGASD